MEELRKEKGNHVFAYLMVEYKVEQLDLRIKNKIGPTSMVEYFGLHHYHFHALHLSVRFCCYVSISDLLIFL